MRYVVASNKTRPDTVDAQALPSTKSGFFCAPHATSSPHVNKNDSAQPSRQMRHISAEVAYHCTQQVRDVFHQATPSQSPKLTPGHTPHRAPTNVSHPRNRRLGRTLRKWKDAFLAYFDTAGANNAPHEAINGIIELGRRIARGYRNPTNYQHQMLLITAGLDSSTHTQL